MMIVCIFVTYHMKQHELCMLNHFACFGVINIASALVVVVLLLRLFVTTHLKNRPDRKSCTHVSAQNFCWDAGFDAACQFAEFIPGSDGVQVAGSFGLKLCFYVVMNLLMV